jgi:hypothetical protein
MHAGEKKLAAALNTTVRYGTETDLPHQRGGIGPWRNRPTGRNPEILSLLLLRNQKHHRLEVGYVKRLDSWPIKHLENNIMVIRKKKRKRPRVTESSDYTIQFQDWNPTYSIILDPKERFSPGPYLEINKMVIKGILLTPENLRDKPIELHFQADRTFSSLIEGVEKLAQPPKAVGLLKVRGQIAEFIGSLPIDFFQSLPFILHVGKFKFLT